MFLAANQLLPGSGHCSGTGATFVKAVCFPPEDRKSHVYTMWTWRNLSSCHVLKIPLAPLLSLHIHVTWLITETICSTCVIKCPSAPWSTVSVSVCWLVQFSNQHMDLCVGFCSSPRDKSIPQRTQPLTKVSSRLLMWAVSVAQWQEEIKLFLERTGHGRDSLFFLRLSLSEVRRRSFYLETDGDFFSHQILASNFILLFMFSSKCPVFGAAVGNVKG